MPFSHVDVAPVGDDREVNRQMATNILRGVHDVVGYIDSRTGIRGRAGIIWWLALGGLFLDAFSNSALSAGLGPMTRDLELSATQIALLTSMASWVAGPRRRSSTSFAPISTILRAQSAVSVPCDDDRLPLSFVLARGI